MDRLSAISDAGSFSAVLFGAFFCSPYPWEGADWAPATELQPYLRKNYKPSCLWFFFIYNKDFSDQNLSFPVDVVAFPEQGPSRPSVVFCFILQPLAPLLGC